MITVDFTELSVSRSAGDRIPMHEGCVSVVVGGDSFFLKSKCVAVSYPSWFSSWRDRILEEVQEFSLKAEGALAGTRLQIFWRCFFSVFFLDLEGALDRFTVPYFQCSFSFAGVFSFALRP